MGKENILSEPLDSPNTPGSSGRTPPGQDGVNLITEAMLREEEELRENGKMEEKMLEAEVRIYHIDTDLDYLLFHC